MREATRVWIAAAALLAAAQSPSRPALVPTPPRALVVVAPERFHDALREYVAHKRAERAVELASLERALAGSPGADDAEKLKRFLFAARRERGAGYALLVGDADVMPVRYMCLDRVTAPAFDYAFYPCDLYFADLAKPDGSFDDWNARKDGFHARYFGEVRGEKNKSDPINFDAVDYRPEIAVGRWPVSTSEEVAIVAAKTVARERALERGDAPGARTAAFLASGGWVDARGVMDRLAASLRPGWTAEKRYYRDAEQKEGTPPPDEKQAIDLLNAGVGLLVHAGHGHDHGFEGSLSTASLARVKNADRLPVVLSAGCSTARLATLPPYEAYVDADGAEHKGTNAGEVFTEPPPPPAVYQRGKFNPTGFGEQCLRAGPSGAVAYFGCNTGSQPCGLTLIEGFVAALARDRDARLGDLWRAAVVHYFDAQHLADLKPDEGWYPPSIFFQGMKFMLFGDPTLRMTGR